LNKSQKIEPILGISTHVGLRVHKHVLLVTYNGGVSNKRIKYLLIYSSKG